MTTKLTIVPLLALTILGFGITQMAYAEEATKLDPTSPEGTACIERIQEDTKRQIDISEADRQRSIGVAISSNDFKAEVGSDSYQYGVITTGWKIDPQSCTAGLLSTSVHFRATDENGETREVIVSVDPSTFRTTDVKVVYDNDRPIHSGVIPSLNYAGYSIAGNSAETEPVSFTASEDISASIVYRDDYSFLMLVVAAIVTAILYTTAIRNKVNLRWEISKLVDMLRNNIKIKSLKMSHVRESLDGKKKKRFSWQLKRKEKNQD